MPRNQFKTYICIGSREMWRRYFSFSPNCCYWSLSSLTSYCGKQFKAKGFVTRRHLADEADEGEVLVDLPKNDICSKWDGLLSSSKKGKLEKDTECSLNIVFFPENFVIFLNSASSAAALVFYLPGVCTHTDTERKQSPEYFEIFEKNTIFNERPVF